MSEALFSLLCRPEGCGQQWSTFHREGEGARGYTARRLKWGPYSWERAWEGLEDRHVTSPDCCLQGCRTLGWRGKRGGFPFDPRAPKMLSARPRGKSSQDPCAFQPRPQLVLQPPAARTLFMAAPFSSPCLQAPKASGQARGLRGRGAPCPVLL